MTEVLEPAFYPSPNHTADNSFVQEASRLNRAGLLTAQLLRAAGVVSLLVGAYAGGDNTLDIYAAKDELVADLGNLNSGPMDRAASQLLSGASHNPEKDGKTAAKGYSAIDQTINTGVNRMVHQGTEATEGYQDIVIGSLLLAGGQLGLITLRHGRNKQAAPHTGNIAGKAVFIGAGAALVAGLSFSSAAAEAGDRSITKPVDNSFVEPSQEFIAEQGAKVFKNSFADEIQAAVEAELPLTMKAIKSTPEGRATYEKNVQDMRNNSQGKIGKLAEVDPAPSYFVRMRERLNNTSTHLAVALMSGGFLISRLRAKRLNSAKA